MAPELRYGAAILPESLPASMRPGPIGPGICVVRRWPKPARACFNEAGANWPRNLLALLGLAVGNLYRFNEAGANWPRNSFLCFAKHKR